MRLTESFKAFPIQENTFVGVAARGMNVRGFMVLHVVEDGTLTFTMMSGKVITLDVIGGQDIALSDEVITLASTGIIAVS